MKKKTMMAMIKVMMVAAATVEMEVIILLTIKYLRSAVAGGI